MDLFGRARHVGQELDDVGAHGVVGEMMFDAPDGVEAQFFGLECQGEIARIDLVIRGLAIRVLKDHPSTDMHINAPESVPMRWTFDES